MLCRRHRHRVLTEHLQASDSGVEESGDHGNQGRLSAARRSHEHGQFTYGDFQVEATEDLKTSIARAEPLLKVCADYRVRLHGYPRNTIAGSRKSTLRMLVRLARSTISSSSPAASSSVCQKRTKSRVTSLWDRATKKRQNHADNPAVRGADLSHSNARIASFKPSRSARNSLIILATSTPSIVTTPFWQDGLRAQRTSCRTAHVESPRTVADTGDEPRQHHRPPPSSSPRVLSRLSVNSSQVILPDGFIVPFSGSLPCASSSSSQ